jgi:hypothetical protein
MPVGTRAAARSGDSPARHAGPALHEAARPDCTPRVHATPTGRVGCDRACPPGAGDVLADPAVKVVYVALHNSAHLQLGGAMSRAGHVLCKKPP